MITAALPLRLVLGGLLATALWITATIDTLRSDDARAPSRTRLIATLQGAGASTEAFPTKPGSILANLVAFRLQGCESLYFALPQSIGFSSEAQLHTLSQQTGVPYLSQTTYLDQQVSGYHFARFQLIRLKLQIAAMFGQDPFTNLSTTITVLVPQTCAAETVVDLSRYWQPAAETVSG